MPKKISPRLKRALEVFETGELDAIIQKRRQTDFEALREILAEDSDVDSEHRQRAIYALGRWGNTQVVSDLISVLPNLDAPARVTAVDALRRLNTEEARNSVKAHATDSSPDVRKVVVAALRHFEGKQADATLRRIAREDQEGWIRSLAEQALAFRKEASSTT